VGIFVGGDAGGGAGCAVVVGCGSEVKNLSVMVGSGLSLSSVSSGADSSPPSDEGEELSWLSCWPELSFLLLGVVVVLGRSPGCNKL